MAIELFIIYQAHDNTTLEVVMPRVTDDAAGEYAVANWIGPDYSAGHRFRLSRERFSPLYGTSETTRSGFSSRTLAPSSTRTEKAYSYHIKQFIVFAKARIRLLRFHLGLLPQVALPAAAAFPLTRLRTT